MVFLAPEPGVLGHKRGVTPSSGELDRLDLVDEVTKHGIDELAQLVTPTGRVEEDEGTQEAELLSEPFLPVVEEERPSDRNLAWSEHVLAETGDRGPAVITDGPS